MRKQRWLLICMMLLIAFSTVASSIEASANSLKDMKNEKKLLEQKKKNLNATIQNKDRAIKTTETEIDKFLNQIFKVNSEIKETNQQMNKLIDTINQTQEEIRQLQASIKDLEQKIAERDVILRERMRAMQANGGEVSYLDVLLGASSFADFIDRFSAVTTLIDADREIMKRQQADIDQLEEEKKLVENKLSQLEKDKAKLEKLRARLVEKKKEKLRIIDKLEAEQKRLAKEKKQVETEYHDTIKISKELEQKIVSEQKRLAEVARQAEERRRKAREQVQASRPAGSLPSVSDGTWTAPSYGRFTSGFGWRYLSGRTSMHRGVDIANAIGTPVVAAADGVVSYAGRMGGFGNVIMITHSINGSIFTSVYAHLSSIAVSSGQVVDKGQHIGAMGNTGNSTGPHLHFEIHNGNFSGSGSSAVNPLRYVSF